MSLHTLLVDVLVPPTPFVFLALGGVILGLRRSRLARVLTTIGVCGLFILGMPICARLLFVALEEGLPLAPLADPAAAPGAIVILAGDEAHGDGTLADPPAAGVLSLERLRAGAALHRRVGLPVLVSGGSLHPGEAPLAELLGRSMTEDFGVRPRWLETGSHSTWENAGRTAALLRAEGIGAVYLVTQGWHMRRALLAFTRAGLHATAAPVRLDTVRGVGLHDFLPSPLGWRDSYFALHEWIGCAAYALR